MGKKTLIEKLMDTDEKIKKLKESEENFKENLTEFKKTNTSVIIEGTEYNTFIDIDDHAIKWPIIRKYLVNPFVREAILKRGVIYEASKLAGNINYVLRPVGPLKKIKECLLQLMPDLNLEFAQYLDKELNNYRLTLDIDLGHENYRQRR